MPNPISTQSSMRVSLALDSQASPGVQPRTAHNGKNFTLLPVRAKLGDMLRQSGRALLKHRVFSHVGQKIALKGENLGAQVVRQQLRSNLIIAKDLHKRLPQHEAPHQTAIGKTIALLESEIQRSKTYSSVQGALRVNLQSASHAIDLARSVDKLSPTVARKTLQNSMQMLGRARTNIEKLDDHLLSTQEPLRAILHDHLATLQNQMSALSTKIMLLEAKQAYTSSRLDSDRTAQHAPEAHRRELFNREAAAIAVETLPEKIADLKTRLDHAYHEIAQAVPGIERKNARNTCEYLRAQLNQLKAQYAIARHIQRESPPMPALAQQKLQDLQSRLTNLQSELFQARAEEIAAERKLERLGSKPKKQDRNDALADLFMAREPVQRLRKQLTSLEAQHSAKLRTLHIEPAEGPTDDDVDDDWDDEPQSHVTRL